MDKSLWEGRDLSAPSIDVEGVLVLGNDTAVDLHQLGVTREHTVADQHLDVLLGVGEITASGTEGEGLELLLHVIEELLGLGVRDGPLPEDAHDVSGLSVVDLTGTVGGEGSTATTIPDLMVPVSPLS